MPCFHPMVDCYITVYYSYRSRPHISSLLHLSNGWWFYYSYMILCSSCPDLTPCCACYLISLAQRLIVRLLCYIISRQHHRDHGTGWYNDSKEMNGDRTAADIRQRLILRILWWCGRWCNKWQCMADAEENGGCCAANYLDLDEDGIHLLLILTVTAAHVRQHNVRKLGMDWSSALMLDRRI